MLQDLDNTDSSFQSILTDAHQVHQRGLYADAWARLEDLEPIDRVEPETLVLRGSRMLGDGREHSQRADDETHRITCAEFLHAYARHLAAAGEGGSRRSCEIVATDPGRDY